MNQTPRCRMCILPARLNKVTSTYFSYCMGGSCQSRERICQQCEIPFEVKSNGASHKYCAGCMAKGRKLGISWKKVHTCAWCGEPNEGRVSAYRGGWPYICEACISPIKHLEQRLKGHHVSPERARALLTKPYCEVCGIDIVIKVRDKGVGRAGALLVVDHDHSCCPGQFSCGNCIRGLLCFNCNTGAGMLNNDPAIAASMTKYLENLGRKI